MRQVEAAHASRTSGHVLQLLLRIVREARDDPVDRRAGDSHRQLVLQRLLPIRLGECDRTRVRLQLWFRRSSGLRTTGRSGRILSTVRRRPIPASTGPTPCPEDYDITFVGAAYGNRPDYIRALYDAGLSVNVWGPRWSDVARPLAPSEKIRRAVSQTKRKLRALAARSPLAYRRKSPAPLSSDEDMVQMFSRSKINLGFSAVGGTGLSDQPIRQVRLRDFEVPMSGGFYMLERLDEIEEFFIPGKEIVCFEGPEELDRKGAVLPGARSGTRGDQDSPGTNGRWQNTRGRRDFPTPSRRWGC